jgi:tryptophan synthase alpha chain
MSVMVERTDNAGGSGAERRLTGVARIAAAFAAARSEGRAALMPYYTLGYPDPATSAAVVRAIAEAGADLIELGVPFSDPLADGRTIQRSTQVALREGVNVRRCLELVADLRSNGVRQPLMLMGYVNPILAHGPARFVADAVAAGADGLIVPDLPPEEAGELETACRTQGCALVYLLAPTASPERIGEVAARATGFLYLVSLTGVTGARASLSEHLEPFVDRARAATALPLAVGFGISTPEQAAQVGRIADGVIVGSKLIDVVDQASAAPAEVQALRSARAAAARSFVGALRDALGVDRGGHSPA